jgi:hypothetical protein
MKRPLKAMAALLVALSLGGCGTRQAALGSVPVAQAERPASLRIETLPFRQGVSSVTVERLGKLQACVSREGAGLVTEPGPVEVYKMVCESGRVFMARCELRQCRAM